jgi:hypothetical protein
MSIDSIKTALLFPWSPEVDGGLIVETSAHPEVAMRLEYVELLDGWQIVGLDVGILSYLVTSPDLRHLNLPPAQSALRVTIRARNTSDEKQRFPGAKIIGTLIR